jgi:N-acetylglucosamine-6-sulfatase
LPLPRPVAFRSVRSPILVAGGLVVALTILIAVRGVRAHDERPAAAGPNVVLIVVDDMRYDSLWAMSSLNRLAERGVTFTRFFVSTPLCCPSRASIMTGLYARHHGVRSNHPPDGGMAGFDDHSTLATWLQAAGVRTGLVGRYLNGYESTYVPPGWDSWFGMWQTSETLGNYNNYRVTDNGVQQYYGGGADAYSTRVLGQQALEFLQGDRSRRFMLMLTPRAPHAPATPDPIDSGTFKDRDLPLSPAFDEPDVSDKPSFIRENALMLPKDRERAGLLRRRQLESLLSVDRVIDAIVEALRADGRLDQTWIMFTSDNGLAIGEHRLDSLKQCVYEECVHQPLVVIPPGGPAGPRSDDHLIANIDLAPTIAAIMETEPGAAVDGRSLLPLLDDPSTPWRDGLVLEQWRGEADKGFVALRTADRKYVRYENGEEELYDEAADPYELESLHAAPAWAAEKTALIRRLEALLAEPSVQP